MNQREENAEAAVSAAVQDGRIRHQDAAAWRREIPNGYDPAPALKAIRPNAVVAKANRAAAAAGTSDTAPPPVDEARIAELAESIRPGGPVGSGLLGGGRA